MLSLSSLWLVLKLPRSRLILGCPLLLRYYALLLWGAIT